MERAPDGPAGRPHYFQVDHIGLPRALTNPAGQVVWRADARPYGDIVEQAGASVVTNQWLPGQYDERLFAAAGLNGLQGPYYNWNRWYLPSMGRYLELDPPALRGRLHAGFAPEWYSYAGSNPLSWVDPTGRDYITFNGSTLTWVYTQYGRYGGPDIGSRSWPAYSGSAADPRLGRIPAGEYWTSLGDRGFPGADDFIPWGPIKFRLHETPMTRIRNRLNGRDGGFFIHGGTRPGTAGCIEMKDYSQQQSLLNQFDDQMNWYFSWYDADSIEVRVEYP